MQTHRTLGKGRTSPRCKVGVRIAVAAGLGIFNTIGQFGGFVAPYIIGITKENSGSYAAGMLIIAAGLGIGSLIVVAHNGSEDVRDCDRRSRQAQSSG
jgi:nitrate/nitrite transporter NarK